MRTEWQRKKEHEAKKRKEAEALAEDVAMQEAEDATEDVKEEASYEELNWPKRILGGVKPESAGLERRRTASGTTGRAQVEGPR